MPIFFSSLFWCWVSDSAWSSIENIFNNAISDQTNKYILSRCFQCTKSVFFFIDVSIFYVLLVMTMDTHFVCLMHRHISFPLSIQLAILAYASPSKNRYLYTYVSEPILVFAVAPAIIFLLLSFIEKLKYKISMICPHAHTHRNNMTCSYLRALRWAHLIFVWGTEVIWSAFDFIADWLISVVFEMSARDVYCYAAMCAAWCQWRQ